MHNILTNSKNSASLRLVHNINPSGIKPAVLLTHSYSCLCVVDSGRRQRGADSEQAALLKQCDYVSACSCLSSLSVCLILWSSTLMMTSQPHRTGCVFTEQVATLECSTVDIEGWTWTPAVDPTYNYKSPPKTFLFQLLATHLYFTEDQEHRKHAQA